MKWLSFGKRNNDDDWLLARFKTDQDHDALGILFDRYIHLVYGVCVKYLKDRAEAQDAVMGIFEYLMEKLPTSEVHNFKSWLYVVTKNYCLMQLRKEKNKWAGDVELLPEHHLVVDESNEIIDMDESLLADCLALLKEIQQRCVKLFFLNQMSYKDIEEATSLSYNEIKSHIQNGKRNLKICFERNQNER